jgi:hypothetical protein
VGNNETLSGDVNKLRTQIYVLTNDLTKLKQELNKQESPTDEEIEAVILDDDDMEKIHSASNIRAARLESSGFSDTGPSVEAYKQSIIQGVTREYKKNKLMGIMGKL